MGGHSDREEDIQVGLVGSLIFYFGVFHAAKKQKNSEVAKYVNNLAIPTKKVGSLYNN